MLLDRDRRLPAAKRAQKTAWRYGIPIGVQHAAHSHHPHAFWWHGERYRVAEVLSTWRLRDRRWEGPDRQTNREYFRVVTADHQVFELYCDDALVRWVLDVVHGTREEGLYMLALFTGMRQGELLGLRWQSVDLAAGHLAVQTALKNINNRRWLGKLKTAASRRKIMLTPTVIAALRAHRTRQLQERLAAGEDWRGLARPRPGVLHAHRRPHRGL